MKGILKLAAILILALGISLSSQTSSADAAVQSGFYVNNQLEVTVNQFIKMTAKEKVQLLLKNNTYLILSELNIALPANLIIQGTDQQIEAAQMTLEEYTKKFGEIGLGNDLEFRVTYIE